MLYTIHELKSSTLGMAREHIKCNFRIFVCLLMPIVEAAVFSETYKKVIAIDGTYT
jgi:hypothetical protein